MDRKLSNENRALIKALDLVDYILDEDIRQDLINELLEIGNAQRTRMLKGNSDRKRRQLIGAMVPKETAAKYQRAAQASARSMYRFVKDALNTEYDKCLAEMTAMKGKHERP